MRQLLLLFLISLFNYPSYGNTLEKALAQNPQWLSLVHYKKNTSNTGFSSYVDDARFFLSPNGTTHPLQELLATIEAFRNDPTMSCQFPARKKWLLSVAPDLLEEPTVTNCEDYTAWRQKLNAQHVILIFASSYLNSPSSMYGHTFLRFDPPNIEKGSPLLSYALNFGANIPADENGLIYAYKGLAGGYPGLFAASPYYEKTKEYSRLENRDLWEYRLNLTSNELDMLLAHIWELRNINFDYYFFDENCSFRLLELLDIARPGSQLAERFPLIAIPVDTIRAVDAVGMIDSVYYRPSDLKKLKTSISFLNDKQQALALSLSKDSSLLSTEDFINLDVEMKKHVVHLAYNYLRYNKNKRQRDQESADRSLTLLQFINDQSNSTLIEPKPTKPANPETGHKTMLGSVAFGLEDNVKYADIEWRLSYHDLLDKTQGYPKGASLNMGRIVFRLKDSNSIQLQNLEIFDLKSLSPRNNFLKPVSWQVNVGAERQWTNGDDELVFQSNAGGGLTYPVFYQGLAYIMATTRLEYNSAFKKSWDIAAGYTLGSLWQNKKTNVLLAYNQYHFLDNIRRRELQIAFNTHFNTNHALRFTFSRKDIQNYRFNETSLSYRLFF